MTAIEYHALALHVRSIALLAAYKAMLADLTAAVNRR